MLGQKLKELPNVVRFLIDHFTNGAVLGCLFGLILIRTDTAGLGGLLEGSQSVGATALFLAQGALIFGAFGMAVGMMSLGTDSD